jgi:hypothetical protein
VGTEILAFVLSLRKIIHFKDPHSISASDVRGQPIFMMLCMGIIELDASSDENFPAYELVLFPQKYTYNFVPNCHTILTKHNRQACTKQERLLPMSVGSAPYLLTGTTELEGSLLTLSSGWWL